MGAGNSKQDISGGLQMSQSPQDQTSTYDGQTDQPLGAGVQEASQSTKRPHSRDPEDSSSNKRVKRSNSSESFEQDLLVHSPRRCGSSQDSNKHLPTNTDTPTRGSLAGPQGDTHHTTPSRDPGSILGLQQEPCPRRLEPPGVSDLGNSQNAVDDVFLGNDQPPGSAHISGSSSADLGRRTDFASPRREGAISPCASTSELSRQMGSQLSQASQAIVEAAATSRDLEAAVPVGWKGASDQILSLTQREQNRQLLRDAIRELQAISDSEAFLGGNPARSTPCLEAAAHSKQRPYSGDDVDEVTFVAEAGDPLYAFRSTRRPRPAVCESHADTDALESAMYIEGLDNDGDQHMSGLSARQNSGRGHRQRKLVGYWKGWEEGIFSPQALVYFGSQVALHLNR